MEANSVDQIAAVLKNPDKYPSPVRAVGSFHSTERCGLADGGTLIKMSGMNRILEITPDTVTVQAGAIYINIAQELEKQGLQFHVNTEIGSLSAGSAACAGTKDSSMPGEYGQVGSYVVGVKMVLPSGDLLEIKEDQFEGMQALRSSYGTFGVIYEVTFRVRPMVPLAVHHETFAIDEFIEKLPELKARNESMMFYIFPFDDSITVEFRRYNPGATGEPERHIWPLRNYLWASAGPLMCKEVEEHMPIPAVRYKVVDQFNVLWRFKLTHLIQSGNTVAADQIIRYPEVATESRYTFSFWAFPEDRYATALPEYVQFCKDYYKHQGYRSNMLSVGYYIAQDRNALLSYSYDSNVMTVDPVSTANPGWKTFLAAYNNFSSAQGAMPLFNQTFGLTRAHAEGAFGERLRRFEQARSAYDPQGRMLNDYFGDILGGVGGGR